MALLHDEDYRLLHDSGLQYEEGEAERFLVIKNFPLSPGFYVNPAGEPIEEVEILWIVPPDYNTSGGDMFWVYPDFRRADNKPIPNVGGDPRILNGKQYIRWSRHWNAATWKPKIDNIEKVLARIEWALKKPDANL